MIFFLSFFSLFILILFFGFQSLLQKSQYTFLYWFAVFLICYGVLYDIYFWIYSHNIIQRNLVEVSIQTCNTYVSESNSTTSCTTTKSFEIKDDEVAKTYNSFFNDGRWIFTIFSVLFILLFCSFLIFLSLSWLKINGLIR